MSLAEHYDVVAIGAGLAGLSFCQHLVRTSDKKVLLLERRAEIPPRKQKVGESLVQVGGYYFSKVLDMEEYLLRTHYPKYNLRFYWKSSRRENKRFEDFTHSYIRNFSNIPCYQLDRNKIEAELFRRNRENPNFTFCAPIADLDVSLSEDGPHTIRFTSDGKAVSVTADWVVDTSGRGKFLGRKMDLERPNTIRHGTTFFWVDGLVDIDKLTDLSPKELRLKKDRRALGHLPFWLATNHFCGEGFWFWVIPLQGITSFGLVYDNRLIPREEVETPEKLVEWVCRNFPLFEKDLRQRKIIDQGSYKDYSYGCLQTIHESRWALSGESGRFTDPLYSPGSDFIALHNTLIIDAILTKDRGLLSQKCRMFETLMRAVYESLVPTYAVTYDTLGDPEAFSLKYTWELSAYFAFYVFPFINDLSADTKFLMAYLGRFSRLGQINRCMQPFLSAFYQWKKVTLEPTPEPVFHDLMSLTPLRKAETVFYEVGVSPEEAARVLDDQLDSLRELARFIVTHVTSVVLEDERVLTNRAFIEGINLNDFQFDPAAMRERYAPYQGETGQYTWPFDPGVLKPFRTPRKKAGSKAAATAA